MKNKGSRDKFDKRIKDREINVIDKSNNEVNGFNRENEPETDNKGEGIEEYIDAGVKKNKNGRNKK